MQQVGAIGIQPRSSWIERCGGCISRENIVLLFIGCAADGKHLCITCTIAWPLQVFPRHLTTPCGTTRHPTAPCVTPHVKWHATEITVEHPYT